MIGQLLAAFGCGLLVGGVGAVAGMLGFSFMVMQKALG